MMFEIFILMTLLHLISYFLLQPMCINYIPGLKKYGEEYKSEYLVATSFIWSIMILIPPMLMLRGDNDLVYGALVPVNTVVYFMVEYDSKIMTPMELQPIHFAQIIFSFAIILGFCS